MRTLYRYRVGDIRFDEAKQELVVGGLTVDVQTRPLAILSLLLSLAGQAVTHEELFEKLWAKRYASGDTNALANAITKLRNALGVDGPKLIENVPTIGRIAPNPKYRLTSNPKLWNRCHGATLR